MLFRRLACGDFLSPRQRPLTHTTNRWPGQCTSTPGFQVFWMPEPRRTRTRSPATAAAHLTRASLDASTCRFCSPATALAPRLLGTEAPAPAEGTGLQCSTNSSTDSWRACGAATTAAQQLPALSKRVTTRSTNNLASPDVPVRSGTCGVGAQSQSGSPGSYGRVSRDQRSGPQAHTADRAPCRLRVGGREIERARGPQTRLDASLPSTLREQEQEAGRQTRTERTPGPDSQGASNG